MPEPVRLGSIMLDDKYCDEKNFIDIERVKITNKSPDYGRRPIRVGVVETQEGSGAGAQGYRVYSNIGTSVTITSNGGGAAVLTGAYLTDYGNVRKLEVSECKSLMGFPASHRVSPKTKGIRQLGNAAIPKMVGYAHDCIRGL